MARPQRRRTCRLLERHDRVHRRRNQRLEIAIRDRTPVMFNSFERMVAFRYLRARRAEGFVSGIAIFSFLGLAPRVAALNIVIAVMNGFRAELVGRILGLNGHLAVYGEGARLTGFET